MILKKFQYIVATGFGIGYSSFIPGTVGSLFALLLFVIIPLDNAAWILVCILTFFLGIWVSDVVENDRGKDPKIVVIDEIVGQWITFLFLPPVFWIYIAGFLLFRVLDIIKPFPANKMENLRGGMGIMLDDVVAGIYANLVLQIAIYYFV
jgi:phosphatidylglycerophosphatase A